jgi:hypothetical protein
MGKVGPLFAIYLTTTILTALLSNGASVTIVYPIAKAMVATTGEWPVSGCTTCTAACMGAPLVSLPRAMVATSVEQARSAGRDTDLPAGTRSHVHLPWAGPAGKARHRREHACLARCSAARRHTFAKQS